MLNIGATELVIILVVALLVLGPTRLPDVATGLGKAIREFRKAAKEITTQLEVDESISQPFQELRSALNDLPAPLPRVKPPEQAPVPVAANSEPTPVNEPVPVDEPVAVNEPTPVPQPVAAPEPVASPDAVAATQLAPAAPSATPPAPPAGGSLATATQKA